MRSIVIRRLSSLALGLPLACGAGSAGLGDSNETGNGFFDAAGSAGRLTAAQSSGAFPGGGTSGAAQPLSAALAPDTSGDCNPQPTAGSSTAAVQTVCFFSADEANVPAATIEQVVEVVGNAEWVHLRLTLNPDFVDNTYGDNAIGWGADGDDGSPVRVGAPPPPDGAAPPPPDGAAPPPVGAAPPPPDGAAPPPPDGAAPPPPDGAAPPPPVGVAPPPPDGAAPPPDGAAPPPPDGAAPPPPNAGGPGHAPKGPGGAAGPRPGKGGHTFDDLVGSDHAEIELLDANGDVAMHFKIDYVSKSASAPSGYASLGVDGGEGKLILGQPEWILATATSIDRDLNACGLSSFVENSPATDASYTPNAEASAWDYRVAYEIWVSTEAFGNAGFGSALIDNVHASPSKGAADTATVLPAPCPVDPNNPDAVPQPLPVVLQTIR